MNRWNASIFTAVALTLVMGGRTAHASPQEQHVLYLLDTTGSMLEPSTGGMTRLEVAKTRVIHDMQTVQPLPTTYALWTFEGSSFTQIYSFTDVKTLVDLESAVAGATSSGGATPLAGSICSAVDTLLAYLPAGNPANVKRIYLATDGLENNTPGPDQCFGSSSATVYPTLTPHSWQWRVRNKACVGNAEPAAPGAVCPDGVPTSGNPITLLVDIDHLFDNNIPFAALSRLESGAHNRSAFASIVLPPVNADAAFFSGLTAEKHGHYVGITSSTPPSVAAPIAGDVNLDGCVNVQDRALVLQQFGTPGPSADLNRDGIVNTFDLQTVLQNFGRGCIQ
jgi:hypothetical protein